MPAQSPANLVAGALAHLARHMTTGCPRAAELAALLLARVAADADADPHLRKHAHELVDILEREQAPESRRPAMPSANAALPQGLTFPATPPTPAAARTRSRRAERRD